MNTSDKTRFGKIPLTKRRGIYLDHYPDSWFQFAVRDATETEAINDRLAGIGKVTEDVTQSVFDKTFRPPAGSWTLLVHLKAGAWSVMPMMQQSPSILDKLGTLIDGEYMIVRHSDCSGVYSVMRTRDGKKIDHLYSDGEPWDDDDEFDEEFEDDFEGDEEDGFDQLLNGVQSDTYTMEWFNDQPDLYSAIHQVLSDWDAFIPDYWWDEEQGLTACQKQLCGKQLIKRIDLVRFGEIDEQADADASKQLADAIRDRDIDGVRHALSGGASLTQLPETDHTAIDLLCSYLPADDRNVVEIAEQLLTAGAASDGGAVGKKGRRMDETPLCRAVAANFASPRAMFDLANLLVRHCAAITADPTQGLDDSPLEAAFNRGDSAWMIWALSFDQPPELLQQMLQKHQRSLKQMASLAGKGYAQEQRERFEPIVEIVEQAIAGNPPDASSLPAMIDQREAEYQQQRAQLHRSGAKIASAMQRLAGTYATEQVDGEAVPVFDGFDVTEQWINQMPRNVKLVPTELGAWLEDDEVSDWTKTLEKAAFRQVGQFCDESGWGELVGYCQPFRDLYAVVEKIGDDVRARIIRRLTNDRYMIATNQKRMWNQTLTKIEVDWVTHRDAEHLLRRPILSASEESESASADKFVEHYERAHWHLRRRLRECTIAESG